MYERNEQAEGRALIGQHSPWGWIESAGIIAPGISQVATPSHGGVKLSAELNRRIPAEWRREGGWYEEDCEWSIAFAFLRDEILQGSDETAKRIVSDGTALRTLKGWYPTIYKYLEVSACRQ